jgi:hypothetical protein
MNTLEKIYVSETATQDDVLARAASAITQYMETEDQNCFLSVSYDGLYTLTVQTTTDSAIECEECFACRIPASSVEEFDQFCKIENNVVGWVGEEAFVMVDDADRLAVYRERARRTVEMKE